jgi:molecular chaperone DnaJ
MEKSKDYSRILGVARDASAAAIKRAYRRLAKMYHPDVSSGSPEDFKELQAAYETLTDADRRRRYDAALHGAERFEPLSWSFDRSPGLGGMRRPIEPDSVAGEILLTPSEAASGGVLPLEVPVVTTCYVCEGTGGFVFDCERCLGEGTIERRMPLPVQIPAGVRDGAVFQVSVDDPTVRTILLTVHLRR